MKKLVALMLFTVSLFAFQPMVAAAAGDAAAAVAVAAINVNTATVKELQSLPGIGKVTAENIVAYRTEKGRFEAVDDLKKVKGIGAKTLEKIRGQVTIE